MEETIYTSDGHPLGSMDEGGNLKPESPNNQQPTTNN